MTDPINIADLERLAAETMEPGPHGYFAGGAGDERSLRRNVEAFAEWELCPRVLVDVSGVTTRTTVLGAEVEMPILVAPVAFQRLAHPGGEPAMACAARAAGTIMCVSTLATAAPAECAAAAEGEGRRWLQLYVFRDRAISKALIDEATAAGYEAIVLTVDAPYGGRRERDLRSGFTLPADVRTPAIDAAAGTRDLTVTEVFDLVDPSLTWSDVETVAADTELPVLIKGVLTSEDAELAVEHGAAGVVVSNHGARQLDAVPASIDVLEEVVNAVAGRIEVLMDGGVRRGTDVAVALGVGASAVMVGRPALWGLAVDGQAGAERALGMLRDELELALALIGAPSPEAVTRSQVRRRR